MGGISSVTRLTMSNITIKKWRLCHLKYEIVFIQTVSNSNSPAPTWGDKKTLLEFMNESRSKLQRNTPSTDSHQRLTQRDLCFSLHVLVSMAWLLGFFTLVKAAWHGYRETSIRVTHAKKSQISTHPIIQDYLFLYNIFLIIASVSHIRTHVINFHISLRRLTSSDVLSICIPQRYFDIRCLNLVTPCARIWPLREMILTFKDL